MSNINAFRPVVHEKKIFKCFSQFYLFWSLLDPKRGQSLYLNTYKSPSTNIFPTKVNIGQVILEKNPFKGKS